MLSSKLVNELNMLFADELKISAKFNKTFRSEKWVSPIGNIEIGEYLIVLLSTPKKVKSEGYLMQNCVRQYVHLCQEGEYLLFSIQNRLGERVATLGVKKGANRWYFDDCLGIRNSVVIETTLDFLSADNCIVYETEYNEIFSVAHEVVRLLNYEEKSIHSPE